MAHEAQTLVDKAKTKLVIKPKMDGDEQNHCLDIWEDPLSIKLFIGGSLDGNIGAIVNIERVKRRVMRYHQQEDTFYFQNLVVPKSEVRFLIMKKMHNEIEHFGEARTLAKTKKCFFWHDKTDSIKEFVNR